MKTLNTLFAATLMLFVGLFMFSCSVEDEVMEEMEQVQVNSVDSAFDDLILDNLVEDADGVIFLELTPEEFEQALDLTFEKPLKGGVKAYFEDADLRRTFRENTQQVLLNNDIVEGQTSEKFFCEMTYFAEAYSAQQGYTSSSSNSFAYARRDGTTNLWASAFSCITFDEVYTGYYSTCPWTGTNCEGCRVRALYYSGGGNANIFGIGSCTYN